MNMEHNIITQDTLPILMIILVVGWFLLMAIIYNIIIPYFRNKTKQSHSIIKKKKKEEKRIPPSIEELQFYNSIDFEAKKKLLDDLINECIDEYALLNLAFKENIYITEDMEREMIRGVLERFITRMSKAITENLYLIYNAKSDDELISLISTQVALKVVNYKVQINSPNNEIQ